MHNIGSVEADCGRSYSYLKVAATLLATRPVKLPPVIPSISDVVEQVPKSHSKVTPRQCGDGTGAPTRGVLAIQTMVGRQKPWQGEIDARYGAVVQRRGGAGTGCGGSAQVIGQVATAVVAAVDSVSRSVGPPHHPSDRERAARAPLVAAPAPITQRMPLKRRDPSSRPCRIGPIDRPTAPPPSPPVG